MERDGLELWRISTHLRDEYRMARSGGDAMRLVRYAYRKVGCAPKYLEGWSAERLDWDGPNADLPSAPGGGEK